MNEYNIFFGKYKKEIEIFQNGRVSICDDLVYDDFGELDYFVNALIAFVWEHHPIFPGELSVALNYITRLRNCGTDDNFMGLHLRMAYFHCIGAIVEYLDFIRGFEKGE